MLQRPSFLVSKGGFVIFETSTTHKSLEYWIKLKERKQPTHDFGL